ncbi:MAG: hypothetical protein NZL83_03835 [Candidatus Absconditabacterales bacterium]|nr:hypothetical protein [Candidatus Absconditabacterales bacterium]
MILGRIESIDSPQRVIRVIVAVCLWWFVSFLIKRLIPSQTASQYCASFTGITLVMGLEIYFLLMLPSDTG